MHADLCASLITATASNQLTCVQTTAWIGTSNVHTHTMQITLLQEQLRLEFANLRDRADILIHHQPPPASATRLV
jgi:hypothetical protein